jgi:heme oxygenase
MERLKADTADLHREAEGAEFQQRMVAGLLSREDYISWLGQMLHVHTGLEAQLRRLCATDPRFAPITPEQFQEPYLVEDLTTFGVDPATIHARPAVARLLERIAREAESEPLRLLGYHYVLEGSNNGNRFVARRLRPALGLEPGAGDRYLDPYGEAQVERWRQFKDDMTGVGFTDAEIDLLVAAARDMFAAIRDLSGELSTRLGE